VDDRQNFDIPAHAVSNDVGNVVQHGFPCSSDASDPPHGWLFPQQINRSTNSGNYPGSSRWIILFDMRTNFIEPSQRP